MLRQANNVSLSLDALLPENASLLQRQVARAFGVAPDQVRDIRIVRKSVDARKRANVHFVVNVQAEIDAPQCDKPLVEKDAFSTLPHSTPQVCAPAYRPLVVGTGPTGLFCALRLAEAGLAPLMIERGKPVDERAADVAAFAAGGTLNPQSNVQFGEGGAGTFSDGKLTTGTKSPHARTVLQMFAACGAPADILVDAKPHIGTDYLPDVVRALRERIIAAGGEVRFNTQLVRLHQPEEPAKGTVPNATAPVIDAVLEDVQTGKRETVRTNALVLACGHSARDTYEMLLEEGVHMQRKPFAMGVRIEHPQEAINRAQYGAAADHPALGAADYKLATHNADGRGVYTFCMCPGGTVVAAASEAGGVCTNGMSTHARNGQNANAALLVEVRPDDFPAEEGVLAGMYAQRALEQRAFQAAGGTYAAPAQTVGEFLGALGAGEGHVPEPVAPTYPRGVVPTDLHQVLPPFVTQALEEALPALGTKLRGFNHPHALMTAPEARSSSPVQLVRNTQSLRSTSHPALYPAGEGAGHAGGIMSAACDGLRVADAIIASAQIAAAATALAAGKPAVFPTDTVAGVAVSVDAAADASALAQMKGRPAEKPIAWLVADATALDVYACEVPAYARQLAAEHWPGVCTLVMRASSRVPRAFQSESGTIGLRVPDSWIAQELIRAAGAPLATTSANLAGEQAPASTAALSSAFIERAQQAGAAFVISSAKGTAAASTVIDCTGPEPRILRP